MPNPKHLFQMESLTYRVWIDGRIMIIMVEEDSPLGDGGAKVHMYRVCSLPAAFLLLRVGIWYHDLRLPFSVETPWFFTKVKEVKARKTSR